MTEKAKVFDENFERYDRWFEREFGRKAFALEVECLKSVLRKTGNALEVGVGTGRFAKALSIRFGLDPSLKMLSVAKERGVLTVAGVGEALPFRSESFDAVFLIVTLCFVDDIRKVLSECARVLKPSGYLYIGTILSESSWSRFYLRKAKEGHPIYKLARFPSLREILESSKDYFTLEEIKSTLVQTPSDTRVENFSVTTGFHPDAGFTCIRLKKRAR